MLRLLSRLVGSWHRMWSFSGHSRWIDPAISHRGRVQYRPRRSRESRAARAQLTGAARPATSRCNIAWMWVLSSGLAVPVSWLSVKSNL